MNLIKYKSGPGLDIIALQKLELYLNNFNNSKQINILEFGSGFSTQFLVDYKYHYNKNIIIDSFDNDKKWCFQNSEKYPFLNLNITPLISCTEEDFNYQLNTKKYNKNLFQKHIGLPYGHPNYWRQRNCFYDIDNTKLQEYYDIIIIDGPNGNGRNISYLHIQDKIKKGSIILIDDFNSHDDDFNYNFIKNLKNIIHVEELYTHTNIKNPSWENGGNFAFYNVK